VRCGISPSARTLYRRVSTPRSLWWLCVVAIVIVQLAQAPGSTTFDTKLDLVVDPGAFMARSLDIWSSASGLGELQNQAYGYLEPIGPFFWVGHVLSIPAWLWERLWSALLMLGAFEGMRRLAAAWGGLGSRATLLAGLAYVVAPRFLTTIGTLSGETLPTAVLPWTVLPLVLARRGRLDVLPAVGLSALSVVLMGGHNAVETVATLPLPATVVIAGAVARQLPLHAVWLWAVGVVLACAWWIGPLLVLGEYSPPFLDYIESAEITTTPVGWTNALRGTDHWLAGVSLGGHHWWEAGYLLLTDPVLIVVTTLVAAIGLCGLLRPDIPDRTTLVVPLAAGLLCLVAAHGTAAGGLFAGALRDVLDGPLAALRNIHKVDPLVRLPLALGFAFAASASVRVIRREARRRAWMGVISGGRTAVAGGLAALLLAASAAPAFAGVLRFEPGWDEFPAGWTDAASAVDALPEGSRVLVAPGTGSALQIWGYTVDEPAQPLVSTPWVVRGQAPLAPGGTTRYLDSIESILSTGTRSGALAPLLSRAGITHVLVRSDLDPATTDAPASGLMSATLRASPGLALDETFAEPGTGTRPFELWSVEASEDADPRVRLVGQESLQSVSGGPESIAGLVQARWTPTLAPTQLASDLDSAAEPDALTDGMQRRERSFGRTHQSLSSIMAEGDDYRVPRATPDYETSNPSAAQTVAWYPGLLRLVATSSAGYADILGPVDPSRGPYSAIDGQARTSWVSAPFTDPAGQGVTLVLGSAARVKEVTVTVPALPDEPEVTAVTVATDNGSSTEPVDPFTGVAVIGVPKGPTRAISVTIAGARGPEGNGQVGITEIQFSGATIDTSRYLIVPDRAGRGTALSFQATAPSRACRVLVGCRGARMRAAEEASGIYRVFRTDEDGSWLPRVRAVAVASPETLALLAPRATRLTVVGSSVFGNEPGATPVLALDDDPRTGWTAAPGDADPTLTLDWGDERELSAIRVRSDGVGTRSPVRVRLESGGQVRVVTLDGRRPVPFRPLSAQNVTLTFFADADADAEDPMRVSDLELTANRPITFTPVRSTPTGEGCGFGPDIVLDDQVVHTRVSGTLGQVLAGTRLRVVPCPRRPIAIDTGVHRLLIPSTARYQPVSAFFRPAGATPSPVDTTRELTVDSWSDTRRTLTVGGGGPSVLWVTENTNPGWQATLDGRRLDALVVDGWAQGWLVPDGEGGSLVLTYGPQRTFQVSLIAGGCALVVLAALTGWAFVRRSRPNPRGHPVSSTAPRGNRWTPVIAWEAVAFVALLGGAGVLVGAATAALPAGRRLLVRCSVTLACCVIAACLLVAGDGMSVAADVFVSAVVGIVLCPVAARMRGGRLRA
jgi:arabinofuranan 3-O-arabinosyltransferase